MKFRSFLLAMMLCALCVTQASALEYTFDAPEDYTPFSLFHRACTAFRARSHFSWYAAASRSIAF